VTGEQGAVFDLGYQPHDGVRLGRRGAIFATMRDGVRRILGIRRKARKKVMPWLLFGIALLPVIAIVGFSFLVEGVFEGLEADNPFAGHANIFNLTAPMFLIFTAMAGPELLIPDRVEGVLAVYASRPMRVSDYLGARAAALAIAAGGFLVIPQLILYLGLATLDSDGWFSGLMNNFSDVPKFLLASLFYLLAYGAPAFLVAMFAKRLGPAWGMYLAVMLLSSAFATWISSTTAGIGRYTALAALSTNPDIVTDWLFDRSTFREGITGAGFGPMWSVGVIVGVAVVTWLIGLRRYRSLL
jgi:ABC-2 type transport system permease protein